MKKLLVCAVLIVALLTPSSLRDTQPPPPLPAPVVAQVAPQPKVNVEHFRWLKRYVARFEPDIQRQANLAWAIAVACQRYGLNHVIFARILAQESEFRRGAVNPGSGDYGIGQVNWHTWSHLGLNKRRLQYDDEYNIRVSARILATYRKSYAKHERNWWSRYHSSDEEAREEYESKVATRI